MQKTNFPYEIIIHDDASTDGTSEIVKEYADKYPDLIVPILQKENQYSKGIKISSTYIWPRSRGKYIALCEGDDYWSDPLKLQKQFDFMEKHKDCSMCFHRAKVIIEGRKKKSLTKGYASGVVSKKGSFFHSGGMKSPTASLFIRSKFLRKLPTWYIDYGGADVSLKLILGQEGDIAYLDDVMAVHRIGTEGSWNDRMIKNNEKMKEHHLKAIKMLNLFDEYTSFRHSDFIIEKKFSHALRIFPFISKERRRKVLDNPGYSKYIASRPTYKRLLIRLFNKIPVLLKIYYNIKEMWSRHH